jgi:hypothetical protein
MPALIPKTAPCRQHVGFLTLVVEILLSLFVSVPIASVQSFSPNPPVIDPAYAGSYSAIDIGPRPVVSGDTGALTFKDANTLYIDANTFQANAEIYAITVTRDNSQHITGFSGVATKVANAPYCDGGLQFGPGGVLFYTAYNINQLGQIKPGSINPDKTINLTPLNVSPSVGSLRFVPFGFGGGAGSLKLISWDSKTWYNTYVSPDGRGTYDVNTVSSPSISLAPFFWEGMAFVAAGQSLFPVNSVLINADLQEAVYAFELDANGNPKTNTQKHFMDVSDPVGMTIDPVTGDILISTEQGPLAHHITVVRGFTPVTPPPPAAVTTSKALYNPGETIVVNFSNAAGVAHEWIGLVNANGSSVNYLRWIYTDGTTVGTAGITNGSVSFSGGLTTPGNYEARLFYENGFAIEGSAYFSVQDGPPSQATNPNPASGSTGTSLTPTLSWTAGIGAVTHQVYFGTNPNPGAPEFKGSQSGTTYNPGTLAIQTTYYWRIDEVNDHGTATGIVWSFTTGSGPPAVSTNKASYAQGEAIVANFSNASGNSRDWIGLFAAGAPNTSILQWYYTDGTQTGTPGITNGSVTFPSGLPNVGNYEARLFFSGTYTMQASTAFTVQVGPPGRATNPNPANNATSVGLNPTLTWTTGAGATSHKVYFGTNPNLGDGDLKATQTGTSYAPGPLSIQTSYYWRIDEINAQGTTTGVVWMFTTGSPPAISTNKSSYGPGESIVTIFSNASGNSHDWIGLFVAGSPNTSYLQWFYTDGTQTGSPGIINGSVTFPSGLPNPGNYEARLFFSGTNTMQASTAFTVQNTPQATDPNPASNSTGVNLNPTLTWNAGPGATAHRIYFGTNANPGAAEFKGEQTSTTYNPGPLLTQTTYYWRIDEVNGQGTTTGVVWNFTTAASATTPTIAITKGLYARGETIVTNFGNASGNPRDWVGIFAAGAPNTSYLLWYYTDGTQIGTGGIINGSVNFPNGLPNPGNYEARLFFSGNYILKASTTFRVQ